MITMSFDHLEMTVITVRKLQILTNQQLHLKAEDIGVTKRDGIVRATCRAQRHFHSVGNNRLGLTAEFV